MKIFFNALKDSKNKIVRIGYYGDSLIHGDVITEYLREKFQSTFSGKGAGFLSIVSSDIKMKATTKHTFSDDWNSVSIVTRNPDRMPFGINGSVAVPKTGSWVKYESTNYLESTSSFEKAKLYYSHADNSSVIEYKINGRAPVKVNLHTGENVQELLIDARGNVASIEIKFISGKAPYFYCASLESGSGVYVDNFAMPGNSGASLLEIPKNVINDFNKYADFNLIVFNYGANVSSPNKGIYTLYENKMISLIEEFKKLFPRASFLLVSVGDKTMKKGAQFITNPEVPMLLETQKKITEKTKIAFWNLWEAMGGNNSMKDWVGSAPPMALKDYAHFTPVGGSRVAELLFEAIMNSYRAAN
ncbi:MAG: hypothetical protein HYS25_11720 [Ignavibacteriales bacterium]|nr:hypothetical protein [Ignavibacteriales bacterium]